MGEKRHLRDVAVSKWYCYTEWVLTLCYSEGGTAIVSRVLRVGRVTGSDKCDVCVHGGVVLCGLNHHRRQGMVRGTLWPHSPPLHGRHGGEMTL